MTKFFVPKRYDATEAEQGVWFSVNDTNGNHYGEFKCRLIDRFSQSAELAFKRIRQKYAAQIKSKKLEGDEATKVIFVEASLIDWKLPVDPSAKKKEPEPCTVENALEYFSMEETKFVLATLIDYASDIANYAVQSPLEIEAVTGN